MRNYIYVPNLQLEMSVFSLLIAVSIFSTKSLEVSARTRGSNPRLDFSSMNRVQLMAALQQLTKTMYGCRKHDIPYMKRVYLKNATVTCNDGSRAGYYLRKSSGSNKWIVFLEGGWYCFDERSCHKRWDLMRTYMSSEHWPKVRKGTGILSWEPAQNPYYFHSNVVLIPYCSSDSWSGTVQSPKGKFSFMGSMIVDEVIKELLPHGLSRASKLILAGSSAGGTGVFVNLDRVADYMAHAAPRVPVRGLADSGWFIDNKQYQHIACVDAQKCAPDEGIKLGMRLWQGRVPKACLLVYPDQPWKCYFGYRLYPSIRTPVYVVQYLFDHAQMAVDNVGIPISKPQWQYIHRTGLQVRQTLRNVSAVFAPACYSHVMLTNSKWNEMSVNGVGLMKSFHCWESQSDRETSCLFPRRKTRNRRTHNIRSRLFDNALKSRERRKKHKRRQRERRKRRKRRKQRKQRRNKEKLRKKTKGLKIRHRRGSEAPRDKCIFRLMDRCRWPQCNYSCPKLHNPLTGENMDFIDLLLKFGLDLPSMARALGTDVDTIQNTDHTTLLKMIASKSW